jgi:hypothetical protein
MIIKVLADCPDGQDFAIRFSKAEMGEMGVMATADCRTLGYDYNREVTVYQVQTFLGVDYTEYVSPVYTEFELRCKSSELKDNIRDYFTSLISTKAGVKEILKFISEQSKPAYFNSFEKVGQVYRLDTLNNEVFYAVAYDLFTEYFQYKNDNKIFIKRVPGQQTYDQILDTAKGLGKGWKGAKKAV